MIVRVVDRVLFDMDVTSAQAIAYVRKVVPGWEESEHGGPSGVKSWHVFQEPGETDRLLQIPLSEEFRDFGRRMTELCDTIVGYGFAKQPSEVLKAMAQEAR